jgi:hypothetical protein
MPGVTVRDVDVSCNFPVLLLGRDCELHDSFCFAPTQPSQDCFGCCANLLLTIPPSTGSKIHYSVRRVPQATGQTSNSRLELHSSTLTSTIQEKPRNSARAQKPSPGLQSLSHPKSLKIHTNTSLPIIQAGLTRSKPHTRTNLPHNPPTGSTCARPPSPAMSTCASRSASAGSGKHTVAPRTAARDPHTTSTPPAPSTAKCCKRSRSWVSSRRSTTTRRAGRVSRADGGSHSQACGIWIGLR